MSKLNTIADLRATTTDAEIQAFVGSITQTKHLVRIFNDLTGESVKRFATRPAGEKRLIKAMTAKRDELAEAPKAGGEQPDTPKQGGGKRKVADPMRSSGAYIRELLLANEEAAADEVLSDEEIIDRVIARFPDRKTSKGDVSWNRWKLRKDGLLPPRQKKGEA